MSTQDEIFAASEADQWFERNRHALEHIDDRDVPLRLVELYRLKPASVIEIGAANGYRVAEIVRRTGARGVAVEPSRKAIEDGRVRFPNVEFHQGQAAQVPVPGTFELAIVHFVLHWVDRKNLLRVVTELDRLVADDGFLIVGDFYPGHSTQNAYHHLPGSGVMTYKQDYGQLFMASGLYQPVALLTSYGVELDATVTDDRRCGVWLLRKRRA